MQKEDYMVVALHNGAVEKWKQRLIFHVTVVCELFFVLEWSNRKDRNIALNEYSQSEMVSVLCRQV